MLAGREGDHLLAVVRVLYTELGYSGASPRPDESWSHGTQTELWEGCEGADDALVVRLREELAKLALATANAESEDEQGDERAVRAALDGAELVMRGELAAERPEMICTHLPGFTYMVALPGLGRVAALTLSRRAAELIESGPTTD